MRRAKAAVGVLLAVLGGLGCQAPVAAALDEADANRVLVALDQSGVDATKEADPAAEGKFRVLVARDDAARALATMADEQVPRPKVRGVLDAADRGQLVPSQAAEHAQLVAGLAGELERTLSSVEGVLAAHVHLNLPLRDGLRDGPPPKATASVLLEHRGATPPLAEASVQRLVAGGAPGLVPADVTVVYAARGPRPRLANRADVAHVGPIAVMRGSGALLKGALAGLVGLVLAFAVATLALWSKLSRLRREQEAAAQAPRSASRVSMAASGAPHPSVRPPT